MAKRLKFLGIAVAVAAIGLLVASCDTGQQAQQQTALQVLITVTGIPGNFEIGGISLTPPAGGDAVATSGLFAQGGHAFDGIIDGTLSLAMRISGGNQPFSTSGTYNVVLWLFDDGPPPPNMFVIPSRSINAGSNTIPRGDFPQP